MKHPPENNAAAMKQEVSTQNPNLRRSEKTVLLPRFQISIRLVRLGAVLDKQPAQLRELGRQNKIGYPAGYQSNCSQLAKFSPQRLPPSFETAEALRL